MLSFPSICRLTWKFGRSAIHKYFVGLWFSVRNAITDSIFWGQVTGPFLKVSGVYRPKKTRERGSASGVIGGGPKGEKETKKEKETR